MIQSNRDLLVNIYWQSTIYQYHIKWGSSAHRSRGNYHYAYARQTQVTYKKEKKRKYRRKKRADSKSPCAKPKQVLIVRICCG